MEGEPPPKKAKQNGKASPSLPHGERFAEAWTDWQRYRKELGSRGKLTPTSIDRQLKKFGRMTEAEAVAMIDNTIEKGWIGLKAPDADTTKQNGHARETRNSREVAGRDLEPLPEL